MMGANQLSLSFRKLVAKGCPSCHIRTGKLWTLLIPNTLKLTGACIRGGFVQQQDPSTRVSDVVP